MLPRPPTSFIGREAELADARRLLASSRLLTLTGPGGAGKTRLAIELARREAPDRAVFVPLAAARDATLVPVEVAKALGLQDARGTAVLDHLVANLAGRELLLVLDNLEQVLDAATFVAELLAGTGRVRVVATSRAPLRVSGEQELPVPPLAEASRLFVERATATMPGLALGHGDLAAVDRIVERLDGLPLAIELAAARVRVLPPEAILERLDDALSLLVSDRRDVPDRQRTLRAAIAWSHDLLGAPARRLLATCSVFRGGIDLSVLEEVWAEGDLLDPLTELVEHSLLRRVADAPPRYALLETVREFAAEQLSAPAEQEVRRAHARAFWRRVEALPRPPAAPAGAGLDVLEREHDNLRGALDHLAATDPGTALQMAIRLTGFWSIRGHFSEGRHRLGALRRRAPEHDVAGADALTCEAWLATDQGDREAAIPLLDQAIDLARSRGDAVREAEALLCRGRARLVIGDPAGGQEDVERSLALREAGDDPAGLAGALWLAGAAAHFRGDRELAVERLDRSVALCESAGVPAVRDRALQLLGIVRLDLGDVAGAGEALAEAVPGVVALGDRFALPIGLSGLAGLCARRGRSRSALRLAGAADAHEHANQTNRPHLIRELLEGWLAPATAEVGAAAGRLRADGASMTLTEILAAGLDPVPEDTWRTGPAPALTAREREIAVLVAQGRTNREVADELVLSVRTVETHVAHVLAKLTFSTRGQLTAWAHREGLVPDVRGGDR